MFFEQEIIGDSQYFHQDTDGWKAWCDEYAERIKQAFFRDMQSMTRENQRYFGDRVCFEGRSDTGYYLRARFVRFLLNSADFDKVIGYELDEVKKV